MAKKKLWAWIAVIVWVITISYLSFSPLDQYQIPKIIGIDKLAHLILYGVLIYLLHLAINIQSKRFSLALFFAVSFSAITELVQHFFIEFRTGDIFDFLANISGISIVYFAFKRL